MEENKIFYLTGKKALVTGGGQGLGFAIAKDDIGHAAVFLASGEASYITGEVLPVDGETQSDFNTSVNQFVNLKKY